MKHSIALIAAAAAALTLTACERRDDTTAGQKADSTVASADAAAERAKQDAANATAQVGAAADSAGQKIEDAAQKAGDKVADAAITASVNAALARDPSLSALRIDVDTVNGTVSLKGQAPDQAARSRATELASAVKGVTNVDNQLEVRG
jgi:hyperosmotically inducible periplasmic protein